jgi:hypothetical protein
LACFGFGALRCSQRPKSTVSLLARATLDAFVQNALLSDHSSMVNHAATLQSFASEQCPEGFVAVVKSTLRILSVENIGETFNQSVSRLRYTPRRLLVHHDLRALLVAESDYQAVPLADNAELQKRLVVRGWHTPTAATTNMLLSQSCFISAASIVLQCLLASTAASSTTTLPCLRCCVLCHRMSLVRLSQARSSQPSWLLSWTSTARQWEHPGSGPAAYASWTQQVRHVLLQEVRLLFLLGRG